MTNRLAASTSPYLLQHQHNPVDWFPWGNEAFDEAMRRDVPIFLSIGYAACHWCHVMAHESFEDELTADVLNKNFVSIKVDREERPDVDAVYMAAVQAMTGHGGWPMTIFLDLERRPFHAGTYFPKVPRSGMPSFVQLLEAVTDAWTTRRATIEAGANKVSTAITEQADFLAQTAGAKPDLRARMAEATSMAVAELAKEFDEVNAGFGDAPKFPPSSVLEFLLRRAAGHDEQHAMLMVERTCIAMARGGMYDQLAGGFARYSVDAEWVVPHFEKMLYDNAQFLRIYTHWYRATGSDFAKRIATETAEFMLADLLTPAGGFASALDADAPATPGDQAHEGLSYVWTPQQMRAFLGDKNGTFAADLLGVTEAGTFEDGTSVLQLRTEPTDQARWQEARAKLKAARNLRPQPSRDDKVVAAWNGLAIAALAEAGALLGRPEFIAAAVVAAELIERVHVVHKDGEVRLYRVSRGGVAGTHAPGVLEDYGDVAEGLLTLFAITGETRWYELAGELLETALARFGRDGGGFFDTPDDGERLILRPSDPADLASPSGWAATTQALLTYGTLMTSERHLTAAAEALEIVDLIGRRAPRFSGSLLASAQALLDGPREIVIVGDPSDNARQELRETALNATNPGVVIAVGEPSQATTEGPFKGRGTVNGKSAAYVCTNGTCLRPVTTAAELKVELGSQ